MQRGFRTRRRGPRRPALIPVLIAVAILGATVLGASPRALAIDPLAYDDSDPDRHRLQIGLHYRPLGFEAPGLSDRTEFVTATLDWSLPWAGRVRPTLGLSGSWQAGTFIEAGREQNRPPATRFDSLTLGADVRLADGNGRRLLLSPALRLDFGPDGRAGSVGYALGAGLATTHDPLALELVLSVAQDSPGADPVAGGAARLLFVVNERYAIEQSLAADRPARRPVATRWGLHVHYRAPSARHWWRGGLELTLQGGHLVPTFTLSRSFTW